MDTNDITNPTVATKRLTRKQRIFRVTIPAFGALLISFFTVSVFVNQGGDSDFYVLMGLLIIGLVSLAWKRWKEFEMPATVRVLPTKTQRFQGYVGCVLFFFIGILLMFVGGAGSAYGAMFWVLCGLWAIQFLMPKKVITPAAKEEIDRLELEKTCSPDAIRQYQAEEDFLVKTFIWLAMLAIIIGFAYLLFSNLPWWAALIILLLVLGLL